MGFNSLFIIFLVIIELNYLFANDVKYLKSQIVKHSDRCWYVDISGQNIDDIIFKELQRSFTPIINYQTSGTQLKEHCDRFIYVSDNREHMLKSLMDSLARNGTHMRNNKLILLYFDDEELILENNVLKEMHNKALNVLLVRIHRKVSAMILDNDYLGIWNICITAPFLNKTITLLNTSEILDSVEKLFEVQKWRPNFSESLNRTFRISLINSKWCEPMMIRKDDYTDGVEHRIVKEVSRDWKIEYQQVSVTSYNISDWKQIVADLKNGVTDIGTCIFYMSIKDVHNDGSYPYSKVCETFFVPKPLPVNPSYYLYLPLSSTVWIYFIASSVMAAVSMYFFASIGSKTNDSQWINSPFHSMSTCIWNTFTILISQVIILRPSQNSLRIFIMAWVLVCLLVSVGYGTGYTSLMTYPRYTKDINTIEDMVEQENMYWGDDYEAYLSNEEVFSEVEGQFIKEFLNRFKLENDINDRLNRIQNRDYAIFALHYQRKYATKIGELRNASIKFKLITECLMERYLHFPLQENSPYTEIFNDKIHRLTEAGIIDFWLSDVLLKNNFSYMREIFSTALEKHELRPLILSDLQGAFFLLSVGLLSSSVLLLFERFKYYKTVH